MKLYKLTDSKGQTYNHTQWGRNVTHETDGKGSLCGSGWLHAYTDPVLALMLNPIHAAFNKPQLWEAEGEIGQSDRGLKVGTTRLTTVRRLRKPRITKEHRVRFAIACALQVSSDAAFKNWAMRWLNGKDKTTGAAEHAAANAAAYVADTAVEAAHAADLDLPTIAQWSISKEPFSTLEQRLKWDQSGRKEEK